MLASKQTITLSETNLTNHQLTDWIYEWNNVFFCFFVLHIFSVYIATSKSRAFATAVVDHTLSTIVGIVNDIIDNYFS